MKKRKILYFAFFLLALLFILPFLTTNGRMYGADLHFHLMRMHSYATLFESPINFETFYNSGQGINYFYPRLTYYPFYLLFHLTQHRWLSWLIYLLILTFFNLLISFYSVKGITDSTKSAYLFSVLYTFAGYRLHNLIIRFAVGEFIAWTFIPLVLFGFYQIAMKANKKWWVLAIGMTLLIYSHVLFSIITSILLLMLLILTFNKWKAKKKSLSSLVKASLVTAVLTAAFILPMLEQSFSVSLSSVNLASLNLARLPLSSLISENLTNQLFEQHHLGLLLFVCLIVVGLRFYQLKPIEKLSFKLGLVFFLLTTDVFNWDSVSFLKIDYLQFPWRLNLLVTLFIAFAFASHFSNLTKQKLLLLTMTVVCLHTMTTWSIVRRLQSEPIRQPWAELSERQSYDKLTRAVFVQDYSNFAGDDFTGNISEADPRWKVVQHQVYLNQVLIPAEINYNKTIAQFKLENPSSQSQVAYLPVYWYKGQEVRVDNQLVASRVSPWASTAIQLEPGYHQIQVTYKYTRLAKLGFSCSTLAACGCLISYFLKKKTFVKIFS